MIGIEAERFEAIGLQVKNPEIGARPAEVFCGQIIDSNGGVFWLQQGGAGIDAVGVDGLGRKG